MNLEMLFGNPIPYYPATNFSFITSAFVLFPSPYDKHQIACLGQGPREGQFKNRPDLVILNLLNFIKNPRQSNKCSWGEKITNLLVFAHIDS